jgi:ABC-2 type transport system ATP-binding protein
MPILQANNISKSFDNKVALQDFNLNIPKQSIYGLLGPNGSGKTTFLRIVNRILLEDSGDILLNGKTIEQKDIVNIGYLPEERGLYPTLSVEKHLLYIGRLKGLSKNEAIAKIVYWTNKLEMTDWISEKIENLSKGMQQKVQFIIAVITEPQLLILDEPFTGFDPINIELIKNEILELNKKGTTILLSTHRMDSVSELCNYICLINKGQKVLDGNLKEIQEDNKQHIFEIGFYGNMISFTTALWTSAELIEKRVEGDKNFVQIKMINAKHPNDILQQIVGSVQVFHIQEIIPSVNDIFLQHITNE